MLKKILISLFLSATVIALNGCSGGNYFTIKSNGKATTTSTEMSYYSFKGLKYTTLKLKSSDKLTLNIDVETTEGNLKIALVDTKGEEIFSTINPKEHITEYITIPKQGIYYIEVSGDHSGSYEINWDIVQ